MDVIRGMKCVLWNLCSGAWPTIPKRRGPVCACAPISPIRLVPCSDQYRATPRYATHPFSSGPISGCQSCGMSLVERGELPGLPSGSTSGMLLLGPEVMAQVLLEAFRRLSRTSYRECSRICSATIPPALPGSPLPALSLVGRGDIVCLPVGSASGMLLLDP